MKGVRWSLLLTLLVLSGCRTLAPNDLVSQVKQAPATLLTEVPVEGDLLDGGSFAGRLTVQQLLYDGEQVVMDGYVIGTAEHPDGAPIEVGTQAFTVGISLTRGSKQDE